MSVTGTWDQILADVILESGTTFRGQDIVETTRGIGFSKDHPWPIGCQFEWTKQRNSIEGHTITIYYPTTTLNCVLVPRLYSESDKRRFGVFVLAPLSGGYLGVALGCVRSGQVSTGR